MIISKKIIAGLFNDFNSILMIFGFFLFQNGNLRVYGAGLLSSIAELKHSLSPEAVVESFDPEIVCNTECIVTSFQNQYYYTDTFEEAKEKLRYESSDHY